MKNAEVLELGMMVIITIQIISLIISLKTKRKCHVTEESQVEKFTNVEHLGKEDPLEKLDLTDQPEEELGSNLNLN